MLKFQFVLCVFKQPQLADIVKLSAFFFFFLEWFDYHLKVLFRIRYFQNRYSNLSFYSLNITLGKDDHIFSGLKQH